MEEGKGKEECVEMKWKWTEVGARVEMEDFRIEGKGGECGYEVEEKRRGGGGRSSEVEKKIRKKRMKV